MMGIGAVIKTPSGVEFACSSGNRLLDHALVDRRIESVVTVVCNLSVCKVRQGWQPSATDSGAHDVLCCAGSA